MAKIGEHHFVAVFADCLGCSNGKLEMMLTQLSGIQSSNVLISSNEQVYLGSLTMNVKVVEVTRIIMTTPAKMARSLVEWQRTAP